MDRSFDAVVHFQVQLWKLVFLVRRCFLDITQGTGVDNVSHDKAFDGLILGDRLSRRNTSDTLDVSSAVLVTAVIAAFDSHLFFLS